MIARRPARVAGGRRDGWLDPRLLAAIRDKLDLGELIGGAVALQRRGRELIGLCPFHNENTGSFTVNPEKQFYHCFGCGAHGDHFGFMVRKHGMGFREAVAALAARAGVALPAAAARSVRPGAAIEAERAAQAAEAEAEAKRAAEAAAARREAERREGDAMIAAAARVWGEARPLTAGDPAWCYLEGRRLDLAAFVAAPDWNAALRFCPALPHPQSTAALPAMVARVDGPDGVFAGVHRTYLAPAGAGGWTKAPGITARLTLGNMRGGACRLFGFGVAETRLAIAEGIEDALSARQLWGAGAPPVWSALSAAYLGNVVVPFDAAEVLIFADRDPPKAAAPGQREYPEGVGLYHARRLEARLREERRRVRVLAPRPPAKDFNDVLRDAEAIQ